MPLVPVRERIARGMETVLRAWNITDMPVSGKPHADVKKTKNLVPVRTKN